ncbi:MAG: hypothetical protein ACRDNN_09450, partial [Gaiellaceae bacterium]
YSTTTQDGGVSAAAQAAFLTKAYRYVERFPWVKTMFWYAARNSPFYDDRDTYEARFGLVTSDWALKPSYAALRAYALGTVRLVKDSQRRLDWSRPAARVVLRGRVTRRGTAAARTVVIQRRTARGWVRVKQLRTRAAGGFRTSVVARGGHVRYRALARYADARVRSRVVRVTLR